MSLRLAALSSCRSFVALCSLTAASLCVAPLAAQNQIHGKYTVTYSGGTIATSNTAATSFTPGTGQYYGGASVACSTDSSGNASSCFVKIPDPAASPPRPIVATFTWVADAANPSEPPPAAAVVTQDCAASSYINYSNGSATGSGTLDNGSGGSVVTNGPHADCISKKYSGWSTPDPAHPAASFSVVCDPKVTFTGVSGAVIHSSFSVSASVSYKAAADPVLIDLTGTMIDPADKVRKALTGQQIGGSLSPLPTGWSVPTRTWSATVAPVPPATASTGAGIFKTYDPNLTSNQLVPLSTADLAGASFSFYDKTQETITLTCNATLVTPDGTNLAVTAKSVPIAVLKPSVTKWGIATGYVDNYRLSRWGLGPDPATTNPEGESWSNITIAVPAPFSGGQGTLTQLITPDREVYNKTGPSPLPINNDPLNNKQGLDGSFNYGPAWIVPALGSDGDSPGLIIPLGNPGGTVIKLTAADSFITWVMYRPSAISSQGTVWIPLANYSWAWSDTVSWVTDHWALTAGVPLDATNEPKYSSVATKDVPTWTLVHASSR